MREKRKNGEECIRGIKISVNLNKIQRSNRVFRFSGKFT